MRMRLGRDDSDINQMGHINHNPTEPKISLVLIHTAESRPLVHIWAFSH
jgi:hypothetical protein